MMGWWPLTIECGGIRWGELEEDKPVPNTKLNESDLTWGDSPADIVDQWIEVEFPKLYNECNREFHRSMGREMTMIEFMSGLAFSLPGFIYQEYGPIPKPEGKYKLEVRVVPDND